MVRSGEGQLEEVQDVQPLGEDRAEWP